MTAAGPLVVNLRDHYLMKCHDFFERIRPGRWDALQGFEHDAGNAVEGYFPGKKKFHGDFVSRVKDYGRGGVALLQKPRMRPARVGICENPVP